MTHAPATVLRHFMNAVTLCEADQVPQPDPVHMRDAIQHADWSDAGWTETDFTLRYLGLLSADDIEEFDDFSSWVDVENPADLEGFRGGSFAKASRNAQMPPIIIITAPDEGECHTQIGDGRGRVNWAVAHNAKLHAWHMIHKDCLR
jgi:hypothetical protein